MINNRRFFLSSAAGLAVAPLSLKTSDFLKSNNMPKGIQKTLEKIENLKDQGQTVNIWHDPNLHRCMRQGFYGWASLLRKNEMFSYDWLLSEECFTVFDIMNIFRHKYPTSKVKHIYGNDNPVFEGKIGAIVL